MENGIRLPGQGGINIPRRTRGYERKQDMQKGKNQKGTVRPLGDPRHTGNEVTEETTLHRLPTYNMVRFPTFTSLNALSAILVMTLLSKYLGMKAD